MEAAVEAAIGDTGRLDFAVNNAGYDGEFQLTTDYSTEMLDRMIAVNMRGPPRLRRRLRRGLRRPAAGRTGEGRGHRHREIRREARRAAVPAPLNPATLHRQGRSCSTRPGGTFPESSGAAVVGRAASLADLGRAWQVSRQGARHRWNVLKRRLRPRVSRQRRRRSTTCRDLPRSARTSCVMVQTLLVGGVRQGVVVGRAAQRRGTAFQLARIGRTRAVEESGSVV
ncbi:SDR family oxidoreductase [Streptomyces olivaceoviridis]